MEEKIKQANPTLHRYLFTVTTLSKLLAMSLFIVLPFVGFYLGMQYQQKVTVATPVVSEVQKTVTPTQIPISATPAKTSTPTPVINYGLNTTQDMIITDLITDTSSWNSYAFPTEKLTFKYPANWKMETKTFNDAASSLKQEIIILTSPNGFGLWISTQIGGSGVGGGCGSACRTYNISNLVLGELNFASNPLYVVVNGLKIDSVAGKAYTRFNVIPSKECYENICYGFGNKNGDGRITIIGGYFVVNQGMGLDYKYVDPNEFANSLDVKTAVSILKTLHY